MAQVTQSDIPNGVVVARCESRVIEHWSVNSSQDRHKVLETSYRSEDCIPVQSITLMLKVVDEPRSKDAEGARRDGESGSRQLLKVKQMRCPSASCRP